MNRLASLKPRLVWIMLALALTPALAPSASPSGAAAVRVVTATRTGFEPSSLTVPTGRVILIVHNRTGLPQFPTTLVGPNAIQVAAHALDAATQSNALDDLTLAPGVYHLANSQNPHWICQITVQ